MRIDTFSPFRVTSLVLAMWFSGTLAGVACGENEGKDDLNKATAMQLDVGNDGRKLSEVINLLNSAIEKGLDEGNREFAEEMLVGSLLQRGEAIGNALLGSPLPNPQQDPRWLQVRQIALADLDKVVELAPERFEAQVLIGRLNQLPGGDKEAALAAFTTVIDAEKADAKQKAEAYAYRAASQQEPEARLEDLNKAIELDADKSEYLVVRARHYLAVGQAEPALKDIDEAIERDDKNAAAYELRGLALASQDNAEEALEALDRATELAPARVTPYLHRSEIYSKLGNFDKAIEQATKLMELQPASPLGLMLRADFRMRNSQPEEALEDIEQALAMQPNAPPTLLLKARALAQLGRQKEALAQLEHAAESSPQMALHLQIGQFAMQLEMPRRAIESFDKALELEPNNGVVLRFRGDAKLHISQHAEAVADYEQALKVLPDDEGVLNNLAWVLATSPDDNVRDGKRAIELATKAAELSEHKKAHILSTLAAAYAEAGDFDKAIEWAEKAVELNDEEDGEQIAKELAGYKEGKPFRESQQLDAGEREEEHQEEKQPPKTDKPAESKPAPGRTIDF